MTLSLPSIFLNYTKLPQCLDCLSTVHMYLQNTITKTIHLITALLSVCYHDNLCFDLYETLNTSEEFKGFPSFCSCCSTSLRSPLAAGYLVFGRLKVFIPSFSGRPTVNSLK